LSNANQIVAPRDNDVLNDLAAGKKQRNAVRTHSILGHARC
jgi:hypothetical protein